MKKERPILMSTPMVQAILEGRKTMTRRICKLQPGEGEYYEQLSDDDWAYISLGGMSGPYRCPYGKVGDILWVRETYGVSYFNNEKIIYKAGPYEEHLSPHLHGDDKKFLKDEKWKPSIFMPKAACRLKLEITSIRVERLQDISQEDAKAEGCQNPAPHRPSSTDCKKHADNNFKRDCYVCEYKLLWNRLNGLKGFGWDKNPFVWVVEFKKI